MDRWIAERKALLAHEKELTHLRDQIARERRALPWVRIDKNYVFDAPEGTAHARRSVRRPSPAAGAALHARSGLGARLPELLVHGRPHRRHDRAPGASRRHVRGDLARAVGRDRALQAAHGLAVQVGVLVRQRLQPRLPRDLHAGGAGQGRGLLQLRHGGLSRPRKLPGVSVFYKDDAGDRLPHLLDLRARRGGDDGHLQHARPHAQGPRRTRHGDGVGATPRSLRAATGCERRVRVATRRPEREARAWPGSERHGKPVALAGPCRARRLAWLEPGQWLGLATACGVRAGSAGAARRALWPIAIGHAASIAIVACAVARGIAMDRALVQCLAGVLLVGAASVRLLRGQRTPIRTRSSTSRSARTLASRCGRS